MSHSPPCSYNGAYLFIIEGDFIITERVLAVMNQPVFTFNILIHYFIVFSRVNKLHINTLFQGECIKKGSAYTQWEVLIIIMTLSLPSMAAIICTLFLIFPFVAFVPCKIIAWSRLDWYLLL